MPGSVRLNRRRQRFDGDLADPPAGDRGDREPVAGDLDSRIAEHRCPGTAREAKPLRPRLPHGDRHRHAFTVEEPGAAPIEGDHDGVIALGVDDGVSSPTFALVNEYSGKYNIYHFDMYRVNSWDDLYSTGFFDYIDNGILVIEWSENIEGALPENAIRITIEKGESDDERIFEIEGVEI